MPIFLGMTEGTLDAERKHIAKRAVLASLVAMLFFAFSGQILFDFFQISINGLRIVGGFIFFRMGYEMLQAKNSRVKITKEEQEHVDEEDISITPLGIPMITGPGVITNSIVLMKDAVTVWHKVALVLVMMICCAITLVVLFSAGRITRFLGTTTTKVLMRIMGLIIMIIAVEFFFSGLTPMVRNMLNISIP